MTDPIADMLTRIRNAITAHKETVEIPASNEKKAIAEILLNEGWVKDVKLVEDGYNGKIAITLKYNDKKSVISGLQRVSKPGLRTYSGVATMPKVLGGLGYSLQTVDNRFLIVVFKRNCDFTVVTIFYDFYVFNVTFGKKDFCNSFLFIGSGDFHAFLVCRDRVSDSCKHICDRICHFVLPPITSSTS